MIRPDLEKFYALHSAAAVFREYHEHAMIAIAHLIGARRIVELGSGCGVATESFIEVARVLGGRVWSIDIGETAAKARLGDRPEVTFVVSDSVAYATLWEGPIDLLYADSDHSRQHVVNELHAWSAHRPRVIFVDDTLDPNDPHGSPLEAVADFCAESGWRWWNVPIGTGLAILVPPQ